MKRLLFLLTLLINFSVVQAQRYVVTGDLQDSKLGYKLRYATAAILQKDNTVLRGTMTDSLGQFKLEVSQPGNYRVRLSYIGYKTQTTNISLSAEQDSVNIGTVLLESEENSLAEATVTATVARVQQIGDTTQFNAEAYRVPEGSTLEALIKQLPGVEVSDDGTIKWNGKTVSEFLINGKDFFKGDTEIAMKNLPTDLVSKIKAYDKKSDYAEQTGIDDGEETTVLDITTKRELNQSWVSNIDLAYGNHKRYSGKVFATRFTDTSRITAFGSANNVGDRGFGGPRGFGGSQGLTDSKMGGLDFSWENGKQKREAGRFEIGGNVRYNHRSTDVLSTSNTETFLTSGGSNSFGNNRNQSYSHQTDVNSELRLQWNPDSATFIMFRPSFSHSHSRNNADRYAATFNEDPYAIDGVSDPLYDNVPLLDSVTVNRNKRLSLGSSNSNGFGANLNVIRRLGNNGRNLSFRASYNYTWSHSKAFSINNITYYNGTPTSFLNQFTDTPNKNWNYSLRLGYVEPLGGKWYAEARYEYSFRYQDSRRSLYELDSITTGTWGDPDNYPVIGTLPTEAEILQQVRDDFNSQYANYKYYNNRINVGVRYTDSNIRFNAGVSFNPQHTKMDYERPGQQIDTLITRNVFNVSPEVRFRYQFTRTNQLELNYRGSASQPSMTQLLDVVDDSDPLNVSMGNPGLKPSWSNTLRAMYRGYNADRQAGIMGGIDFSSTSNSISTRIVYDDATGVRYSRPENISGNWNVKGRFMYNFGFGPEMMFTLTTHTNLGYEHSVGYVSRMATSTYTRSLVNSYYGNFRSFVPQTSAQDYAQIFENSASTKNTAKTFTLGENLNLGYRASYFDVALTGSLNYQNAHNTVQTSGDLSTWLYSYGFAANASTDWGMSFSTDIRMSSRRGYSDNSMNTNELLWNAQISQSFLSNKALTISVQFYDILHKQSNISRTINAQMRSDTWSNAINSYFMVHAIYKLNIFNGSSSSRSRGNRNNDDMDRGGGMRGMGGGPGGMGGGMGGPGRM